MTEKTKHEFVDDNPYLVYSGEVNTSYSGDSGSGGGGGGGGDAGDSDVFWVTITSESPMNEWSTVETNPTTLSSDKSYTEIVQAVKDGKTVIAKTPLYNVLGGENLAFLPLVYYGENADDNITSIYFNLVMETAGNLNTYHVNFESDRVIGFMHTRSLT